jgi:hypothetical protein
MEIVAGMSAIKTAWELARALRDAAKAGSLGPDEFAGRISEVYDYISDSKEAVFDNQEKLRELQAEIERFKTYAFHHSVNWRVLPDGTEDGPFCPTCVSEGVDMRLQLRDHVDQSGALLHVQCPKSHFEVGSIRDPGRGREPAYAIPKELVPENRYFLRH